MASSSSAGGGKGSDGSPVRAARPATRLRQAQRPAVGQSRAVLRGDGSILSAEVLEVDERGGVGEPRFYVHYLAHDRRLDEWIELRQFHGLVDPDASSDESPKRPRASRLGGQKRKQEGSGGNAAFGALPHARRGGETDPTVAERLEAAREKITRVKNVRAVVFSNWRVEPWYWAPFPESYHDRTLYFCDFTLRYTASRRAMAEHAAAYAGPKRPPGALCYGPDGDGVCLYEVDGSKEKLYCQNLCLLAKLFLDHKTLYYDVDPFLFYVLTDGGPTGGETTGGETGETGERRVLGYFSKEKQSDFHYNLACILTFPQYQRRGLGTLLISLSYELSKRERALGSPEKPLSDLGKLSYRSYWTWVLLKELRIYDGTYSLDDIASKTAIKIEDILSTLHHLNMIRHWKGQLMVKADRREIDAKLATIKRPPRLCDPSKVVWTPKPPGSKAAAPHARGAAAAQTT